MDFLAEGLFHRLIALLAAISLIVDPAAASPRSRTESTRPPAASRALGFQAVAPVLKTAFRTPSTWRIWKTAAEKFRVVSPHPAALAQTDTYARRLADYARDPKTRQEDRDWLKALGFPVEFVAGLSDRRLIALGFAPQFEDIRAPGFLEGHSGDEEIQLLHRQVAALILAAMGVRTVRRPTVRRFNKTIAALHGLANDAGYEMVGSFFSIGLQAVTQGLNQVKEGTEAFTLYIMERLHLWWNWRVPEEAALTGDKEPDPRVMEITDKIPRPRNVDQLQVLSVDLLRSARQAARFKGGRQERLVFLDGFEEALFKILDQAGLREEPEIILAVQEEIQRRYTVSLRKMAGFNPRNPRVAPLPGAYLEVERTLRLLRKMVQLQIYLEDLALEDLLARRLIPFPKEPAEEEGILSGEEFKERVFAIAVRAYQRPEGIPRRQRQIRDSAAALIRFMDPHERDPRTRELFARPQFGNRFRAIFPNASDIPGTIFYRLEDATLRTQAPEGKRRTKAKDPLSYEGPILMAEVQTREGDLYIRDRLAREVIDELAQRFRRDKMLFIAVGASAGRLGDTRVPVLYANGKVTVEEDGFTTLGRWRSNDPSARLKNLASILYGLPGYGRRKDPPRTDTRSARSS